MIPTGIIAAAMGVSAGPPPGGSFLLGLQSAGPDTFPGQNGRQLATQVVLVRPATIAKLFAHLGGTIAGTLYTAIWDGSTGAPGTLLFSGTSAAAASGWNEQAVSSATELQPGRYFIGTSTTGFSGTLSHDTEIGFKLARRDGGTTPPGNFGTVDQYYETRQSCYAEFTPSAFPSGAGVFQMTPETLSISNAAAGAHVFANAFEIDLTPGNSVVVLTNSYDNGTGAITAVNIGGAAATRVANYNAGSATHAEVWVATVGPTPTRDITITLPGGGYYPTVSGLECSPLAASPVDFAVGNTDTNTTPTIAAGGNTTQANVLVIAQWGPLFASNDIGADEQATSSLDWLPWSYQKDSNTYQGGAMAFRNLSSITTPSVTWTNPSGGNWFSSMVGLKFA